MAQHSVSDVSRWEDGVIVWHSCASVNDFDFPDAARTLGDNVRGSRSYGDSSSKMMGSKASAISDIFAVFSTERCSSADVRDAFLCLHNTLKAGLTHLDVSWLTSRDHWVKLLVKCMVRFSMSRSIQQMGCSIFLHLLQCGKPVRHMVIQSTLCFQVTHLLHTYADQPSVVVLALELMAALATEDEVLSRLHSGGYDVMGSLVPLLHTARYSVHAETLVVELMAQLLEQDVTWQDHFVTSDLHLVVLEIVQQAVTCLVSRDLVAELGDGGRLVHAGLRLLSILLWREGHVEQLMSDHVHRVLFYFADTYRTVDCVKSPASSLYKQLIDCAGNVTNQSYHLTLSDLILTLRRLHGNKKFPDAFELQVPYCLPTFHHTIRKIRLTGQPLTVDTYSVIMWYIYQVIGYHQYDLYIQRIAWSTLLGLLEICPDSLNLIGLRSDNSDMSVEQVANQKFPFHLSSFGCLLLLSYRQPSDLDANVKVTKVVCDALLFMLDGKESLSSDVLETRIEVVLVQLMVAHGKEPGVLTRCCQLLSLLYQQRSGGIDVLDPDTADLLLHTLVGSTSLLHNTECTQLVHDGLHLIYTLLSSGLLFTADHQRRELGSTLWQVLHSLSDCSPLVAPVLRTLTSLQFVQSDVDMPSMTYIGTILDTVSRHASSTECLEAGLMLLRQLTCRGLDPADSNTCKLTSDLVSACVKVIRKHDSVKALMEACMLLRQLMVSSRQAVDALVKSTAYVELFALLRTNSKLTDGVYVTVCKCLCALLTHIDVRGEVLVRVCAAGNMGAAELLVQLPDIDVSQGHGLDTALCHACKHQCAPVVRTILAKGSNNDLATPLKLCLQLGYHDLVGLILAHTADLRTDPDTVAWTNLDLPSAHPEWFYATFLPRYSAQGDRWLRILRLMLSGLLPATLDLDLPFDAAGNLPLRSRSRFFSGESGELLPKPRSRCFSGESFGSHATSASFNSDEGIDMDMSDTTSEADLRRYSYSTQATSSSEDNHMSDLLASDSCNSQPIFVEGGGLDFRRLDLSANQITSLGALLRPQLPPPALLSLHQNFSCLHKLQLDNNKLIDWPAGLSKVLKGLHSLNLANNQLTSFPNIFACQHLRQLNVSNNKISHAVLDPNGFLPDLQDLDLSSNCLTSMPDWLPCTTPSLIKLSLSRNAISVLPRQSYPLPLLTNLDLSNNSISRVPDTLLAGCPSLERLQLTHNVISDLPSSKIAATLTSLRVFDASHNCLLSRSFSLAFVLALPAVDSVDLSYNGLTTLPPPQSWLSTRLRSLSVSHNNITHLDLTGAGKFWALTLQLLDISYNKLSQLPVAIGQLTSLTSLNLSHNTHLRSLPQELGKLHEKLWDLGLNGLRLNIEDSLAKGRARDLLAHLNGRLKQVTTDKKRRLVMLGGGTKERAAVVKLLTGWRSYQGKDQVITATHTRCRSGVLKEIIYDVQLLDVNTEHETLFSLHRHVCSNCVIVLVVAMHSATSVDDVAARLLSLQPVLKHSPVILLALYMTADITDIATANKTRLDQLLTSSKIPRGQDRLVEIHVTEKNTGAIELESLIQHLFDIGSPNVPSAYLNLEQLVSCELERTHNNGQLPVMSFTRLYTLSEQFGLDLNKEELGQAVKWLQQSGVVSHFDDVSGSLSNTIILDPCWLYNTLSNLVIRSPSNRSLTEVITRLNLEAYLCGQLCGPVAHVTSVMHAQVIYDTAWTLPDGFADTAFASQLVEIMIRLELLQPLSGDRFLLASFLPSSRPVLPRCHSGDYTRRLYYVSYLPVTLWPRLIARFLSYPAQLTTSVTKSKYWSKGICQVYETGSQVVVEQLQNGAIDISVNQTSAGLRLLCYATDQIDTLLEEWYPHLMEIRPDGTIDVGRTVPCYCQSSDIAKCHEFPLDDLQAAVLSKAQTIVCPLHNNLLLMELLVPDLTLADHACLDDDVRCETSDSLVLLGSGAFGQVFRSSQGDRAVAIKRYTEHREEPPHRLLRQEAELLRQVQGHPSIVNVLSVSISPYCISMELAPCGSLQQHLASGAIAHKRVLLHRIALQITHGLTFIHERHIVYRDMKPDNVLIYSLSTSAAINAKISDFGIAVKASDKCLTSGQGTAGYRAPEIIAHQPYGPQADVFSLGLTLYQLIAGLRHPFTNLSGDSDMERAIVSQRPVRPLVTTGHCWPHMEQLLRRCLAHSPQARPSASTVYRELCADNVLCTSDLKHVCRDFDHLNCAVVKRGRDQSESGKELCICAWSGTSYMTQVTWLSLTDTARTQRGFLFRGGHVSCMTSLDNGLMALGTEGGQLWLCDSDPYSVRQVTGCKFGDSLLCMTVLASSKQRHLLIGLASGSVAVVNVDSMLKSDTHLQCDIIAVDSRPVMCLYVFNRRDGCVLVSSGSRLYFIHVHRSHHLCPADVSLLLDTRPAHSIHQSSELISHLVVSSKGSVSSVFVATRHSPVINKWSVGRRRLQASFDLTDTCLRECRSPRASISVTSMCLSRDLVWNGTALSRDLLWVGTACGCTLVLDTDNLTLVKVIRQHLGPVRAIADLGKRGLASVGLGLNCSCMACTCTSDEQRDEEGMVCGGSGHNNVSVDHGCIVLMHSDYIQQSMALQQHLQQRAALHGSSHQALASVEKPQQATVASAEKPLRVTIASKNKIVALSSYNSSQKAARVVEGTSQKAAHVTKEVQEEAAPASSNISPTTVLASQNVFQAGQLVRQDTNIPPVAARLSNDKSVRATKTSQTSLSSYRHSQQRLQRLRSLQESNSLETST